MKQFLFTVATVTLLVNSIAQAVPPKTLENWPTDSLRTSCQYDNDIFLMGPDNGEPVAVFRVYEDPHNFHAWEYVEILLCKRPDNHGSYAIITDLNKVSNPPQEILSDTKDSLTFTHITLNTTDTHGKQNKSVHNGDLQFILTPASNGNVAHLWVFRTNPNFLGGTPTLESSLQAIWGSW